MKKKGATLMVLHEEYLKQHPEGMRYARFCERYDEYRKALRTSMRFDYRSAGRFHDRYVAGTEGLYFFHD